MKNIATPIITTQANGSFAENTKKISSPRITENSDESIHNSTFTKNTKEKAHNIVTLA